MAKERARAQSTSARVQSTSSSSSDQSPTFFERIFGSSSVPVGVGSSAVRPPGWKPPV
jgi:hypothetical protein